MKNARWKICKRNTSGFTLVEVIVTLVILSILLTGAVMGIASWNRNSIY
ncbi:MAG: type II secretion system protein, partial [Eisenbergiella sp.]